MVEYNDTQRRRLFFYNLYVNVIKNTNRYNIYTKLYLLNTNYLYKIQFKKTFTIQLSTEPYPKHNIN